MENKENVCEQIAVAGQVEEKKSPLGKFKDVNALMEAYNHLQAEFTRRSQRLKELERMGKPDDGESAACGKETSVRAEGRQNLVGESDPDGQIPLEGDSATAIDGQSAQGTGLGNVEEKSGVILSDGGVKEVPTADEVYRLASKDEKVRLQIVGDYLQSLHTQGAPISKGGVGALLTPPKRARDIKDAGNLALRMFLDEGKNQF